MPGPAAPVLVAEALTKRFGGLVALSNYAISLGERELVGLIGPNGAGKTTAFNLLTGVIRPSGGRIRLDGQDLSRQRPERFARAGIARTFQNTRLFRDLEVWENVAVGFHMREGPGWLATVLGLPTIRRREGSIREKAAELLDLVGLRHAVTGRAGQLPYGAQRKVEIARALATSPRILLLDEPAAGMNPSETDGLVEMLGRIHIERPISIVLVDHDMRLVMNLCRRIQVLDRGEVIADGTPNEIQRDERVVTAYLGSARSRVHA